MRTARDLITELARAEEALAGQEFLAPVVRSGRARVRVAGLPYGLRIDAPSYGWWICRMRSARRAEGIVAAEPWQRGEYLALWPALRLILLEPLGHGAWAALPFSPAAAAQRFQLAGPLAIQLVEGGHAFERVLGRVEGGAVWYDQPDRRADPLVAERLRERLAEHAPDPAISGLAAGERAAFALLAGRGAEAQAAVEARRTEAELRQALASGGARLIGYEPLGEQLRVTWEQGGSRSVTIVERDLSVAAAGICLSGEERQFDLTSIVGVVRDAPDFARYEED